MAVITNTFQSTSAVGNREELSDVVNRITPEDTPIYSMAPKGSAKTTNPEWEIDTLRAPAANIQLEGDEFAFTAVPTPTRVGGRTQILREGFIVSETQEAEDNAGKVEKLKHNMLKAGIQIRKDAELAIVENNASVGGATREFGGLPSWYETNTSRGSGGSDGGFSSGNTTAATNGTQRAFTKALMDANFQEVYNAGGNNKFLVVSPYVKTVFTTFMSDSNVAQFRYAASGNNNAIIASADIYEGDFGKTTVIPNRVMATGAAYARNAHNIDPDLLMWKWLDKMARVPNLAKTGDAEKGMIVGEGTLCVKNEAGLGVVADIFGLTAST